MGQMTEMSRRKESRTGSQIRLIVLLYDCNAKNSLAGDVRHPLFPCKTKPQISVFYSAVLKLRKRFF